MVHWTKCWTENLIASHTPGLSMPVTQQIKTTFLCSQVMLEGRPLQVKNMHRFSSRWERLLIELAHWEWGTYRNLSSSLTAWWHSCSSSVQTGRSELMICQLNNLCRHLSTQALKPSGESVVSDISISFFIQSREGRDCWHRAGKRSGTATLTFPRMSFHKQTNV